MVIVFSGGGTAGHFHPARNIAEAVAETVEGSRPFFVGAKGRIEARELPRLGYKYRLLPLAGLRRPRRGDRPFAAAAASARAVALLALAACRLIPHFRMMGARAVVLTGGYACAPAGIAALALRLPIVLQEQNSVPGKTTRLFARWARQVHLAHPEAENGLPAGAEGRVRHTGNPIRPLPPSGERDREGARRAFGVPAGARVVLVVGGSLGAQAINRAATQALQKGLPDRGEFVLWVTGPAHFGAVQDAMRSVPQGGFEIVPYLEPRRMYQALAAADLAVSRAGAMATSEFLAWGLPAVLVPLPAAAGDHQTANARALHESGAAVRVAETDGEGRELDGPRLWREVAAVLRDPERMEAMSRACADRARPDAAREVAAAVAEVIS